MSEIRAIAPDREVIASFAINEPVNCDRGRIAQLASNLMANAVAHGAPNKPIELRATTDATSLVLSVTNAGRPIPAGARERLFLPFFRGAAGKSQQGLGLGLFIVNEIAKAHDGAMDVVSTGELTKFTFSMPLDQAS